ncbi:MULTISPECIES: 23S rRNA (adenine(2030)-N(6))-methyltransferase RlmJ [Ramlibacter]|uniref:Ribosomal RNA large subunit methyltransferase J n=1 Tax=Ramlibacter aquaticus TaxID=2780094 RepID=A0ABR9SAN6_9BURK|nr:MULTISPECIES: 23S rRNA (adenine(2030)-N(6))-methyltransferase RlmJ [Ramlibacter]MBE7939142.1 23S rRNA (adenine(2030)-N(6))-methyltransferase RlmJ [Ramlibacter aquaticus]
MFSYRHAFHAGNHADVLKHMALVAVLRHMTRKDAALMVVDTHAGAGLYRLDDEFAGTSGEAQAGVLRLAEGAAGLPSPAPLLADYLALVRGFNRGPELRIYPGSPFIVQHLLRTEARDKLKLFELHPSDSRALAGNVAQLQAGRQVTVTRQDGFEGLKALLPPPSRRGLVLVDPSYEIKSDYGKVITCVQDALQRFATGTYFIWYPVIPRPEAHDLPRRLKTVCNRAGKAWLHATLAIGHEETGPAALAPEERRDPGMSASGIFVVNPPHTLRADLEAALPQVVQLLGRGRGQGHLVESAG